MDEQQTPTPTTVPLSIETLDAALKVVEEKSKPQTLDPYILFTQIEDMRKEGVDEDTIREAFNQFMASRMGTSRKAVSSMKRTPDSVPMPTQEEINKMYTEKAVGKEILSQDMETILEELENSRIRRANAPLPQTVLKFKDRLAQSVMIFMLRVTVWVFKKFGVK